MLLLLLTECVTGVSHVKYSRFNGGGRCTNSVSTLPFPSRVVCPKSVCSFSRSLFLFLSLSLYPPLPNRGNSSAANPAERSHTAHHHRHRRLLRNAIFNITTHCHTLNNLIPMYEMCLSYLFVDCVCCRYSCIEFCLQFFAIHTIFRYNFENRSIIILFANTEQTKTVSE